MAHEGLTKVFISSALGDLAPYRQAVVDVCDQLGLFAESFEAFHAADAAPLEYNPGVVEGADVFVLLLGHRYGYVPPGESRSLTELEYDSAVRRNMPVLAFVADPEAPWPVDEADLSREAQALTRFLTRLASTHLVQPLTGVDTFRANLLAALRAIEGGRTRSDLCYVSLPFGIRTVHNGEGADTSLDFDRIYAEAVSPAARAAGLTPVRADTLVSAGTIDRAVFDVISRAGVMIADLTTRDPNVLYELGLRHGLSSNTTLVLAAADVPVLDLGGIRFLRYAMTAEGSDADLRALRERLTEALKSDWDASADSPSFSSFGGSQTVIPLESPQARRRRDQMEGLRGRLVEARQLLPEKGLPRLKDLERDLVATGAEHDELRTDLMFAYRDFSAWDDVIRLIAGFPPRLRESPAVVQHWASAHNRRGHSGDPERAVASLEGLIEQIGPDSETYGLLGRIHKDRYDESGDREHLSAAIDAYRNGWRADPEDFYPGINLGTLLTVAGGPAAEEELRELLPQLRTVVDARVGSPRADYWDLATSLELAVLERDWELANSLVAPLRARVASPWMFETTVNNLGILAKTFTDPDDQRHMRRLLRQLTPEVASR